MENQDLRILLVEDEESDRALVERQLRKANPNCQAICVETREDFIEALELFRPDLVLCDYSLPKFGAIEALKLVSAKSADIPVVIVSGTLSDENAVECLKLGATDFVLKDRVLKLPIAIQRALDYKETKKQKADFETKLKKNERQLNTISDALPAFIAFFSKDLKVEFCNKIGETWFDRSTEDIIQLDVQTVFGKEIFERIQTGMSDLLSGSMLCFESRLPNDPTRFISITIKPEIENPSSVQGFVCLMTDISERKRYEEALREARDIANSANRAKSQFLANMSHEMRTPLSVISGFVDLLSSPGADSEDRSVWIEKIGKNADRLRKMIDEILDLAKIEAGKLQLEFSSFQIVDIIAQVKSMLLPLASEKDLKLTFESEGLFPAFIKSDPIKFRHILLNVIGNAIKFSESGPILVKMKMSEKDPRMLLIYVRDRGPGLSPEQGRTLFEPFVQADSSMTRKLGGTGLGLALARRFARALLGDVELIESIPGVGSTFLISIESQGTLATPTLSSLDTTFESQDSVSRTSEAQIRLDGLQILLVDDAPEIRFLLRRFLEMAGAQVEVATNGLEGMNKALNGQHHLVLMDIQMPVLDGYSAISQLRAKGYNKPIFALTAHALKEEKDRCLKMGFNDFLTKPIKRAELLNQIKNYSFKQVPKIATN